MQILLTGASGFLGEFLLRELLAAGHEVLAPSRQPRPPRAGVTWLVADIGVDAQIFSKKVLDSVRGVELVLHAAGLYDLAARAEDLYLQNVIGTGNILQLATYMPRLQHLSHISTVAIAGDYHGAFHEGLFDAGQRLPDAYATTKFAAEHMVRAATRFPSRSVMRLAALVGDTKEGWIPKVDGPYVVQRLLRRLLPLLDKVQGLRVLPWPFAETSKLMLAPVDTTALAIAKLLPLAAARRDLSTYHIVADSSQVSIRRILTAICEHYHVALQPLALPSWMLPKRLAPLLEIPAEMIKYMSLPWTFSGDALARDLPELAFPEFSDYCSLLFTAADIQHFGGEVKRP